MQFPELKDWLNVESVKTIEWDPKNLVKYIKNGTYQINNIKIINYLLSQELNFLNKILSGLGFNICDWTQEDALTLINWYLYYDIAITISLADRNFVTLASNQEILDRLGPNYDGTKNKASLIFAMYTGFKAPELTDCTETAKYQSLIFDPNIVHKYNYLYDNNKAISPIRNICQQKLHPLEYIFDFNDLELYDWCIANEVIPFKFAQLKTKINLTNVYEKLIDSWEIFKLDLYQNLRRYSNLKYLTKDKFDPEHLGSYSDLALIKYFKPPNVANRMELLHLIQGTLHWRHFDQFYYPVDVGKHIITMEKRTNQKDNPLIGFGKLLDYKFYNLDEITYFFESKKNSFRLDGTVILNSQIHQLLSFLSINQINCPKLLKLIKEKQLAIGEIANSLEQLKSLYQESKIKNSLDQFLLQLFYLGLYSRHWKGKATDYPYQWLDLEGQDAESREGKVGEVLSRVLAETSTEILEFFELIPRIQYSWSDQKVEFGEEKLIEVCRQVLRENFCVSHFSNIQLQTIYYLIVEVLKLDLNKLLLADGCQHKFDAEKMQDSYHQDPTLNLKLIKN